MDSGSHLEQKKITPHFFHEFNKLTRCFTFISYIRMKCFSTNSNICFHFNSDNISRRLLVYDHIRVRRATYNGNWIPRNLRDGENVRDNDEKYEMFIWFLQS